MSQMKTLHLLALMSSIESGLLSRWMAGTLIGILLLEFAKVEMG